MEAVFGCSKRGGKTLIYRNFEYWKERNNANGTTSWRCSYHQRLKCKARLLSSGQHIVSDRQPDHTHAGNSATSLARRAIGDMKKNVEEVTSTLSTALGAVLPTLPDHVLMALPKQATLKRALRRHRHTNETVHARLRLPAAPKDLMFDIPEPFRDMVLFDSGPGQDRMIIMGSRDLLDGLARSDVWLADGTFKVVPSIFFQLYSIHFNFQSGINPAAVYCLLTNKTAETYARVLMELRRLVPAAAPQTVLVDFERAAINAFNDAYPAATVTGCYFHLYQSVIRKVNEIGLKTDYENDDVIRGFVRCLPALAFVPPEDVLEAFGILAADKPEHDHVPELLTYFEHTYVRGRRLRGGGERYASAMFPIETWNQYQGGVEGIARTTNSVEGWHYGLQSLFQCHHPTIWSFMAGLKKDIQRQKAVFLQAATGVDNPSTKRYRILQGRVQLAVAAFGRAQMLIYIRAIAHLSHT